MTSVHVLLNPTSGEGAALRRWNRLEPVARSVFGELELTTSRRAGDLRARAAAIARGPEPAIVLAAGGDGTSHEVVNGLLDAGLDHPTAMGWIPLGSGNDLARATGVPLRRPGCLEAYRHRDVVRIDAGLVRFRDQSDQPVTRGFGNSFSLGLSADVLELCRRTGKRLGGRLAYALATVRALAVQRPIEATALVDGVPLDLAGSRLLSITNGPTVGAGMMLTPNARLDDGRFDLLRVGPMSLPRTLFLFPRIFRGGHLGQPGVDHRLVERLELPGAGAIAFEVDGELIEGRLPLSVELLPGALRILRPTPPPR